MPTTDPPNWRRIARRALDPYGLTGARLRPLRGLKARGVFRVDALGTHNRHTSSRYVLRIHGPEDNRQQLRSVLLWLAALRTDTDLGVPEPVPTTDGELLSEVPTGRASASAPDQDQNPNAHCCELLRWLEGRVPSRAFSQEMLERLGALTARLHEHAARFVPPSGFTRPPGDASAILCAEKHVLPRLQPFSPSALTKDELQMVEDTETLLRKEARHLPRTITTFGLMHGDLHPRNLLFHQGDIRAIDFETCGPDYFLYDLATSLVEGTAGWHLLDQDAPPDAPRLGPGFAARRDALLRGYAAVRAVPGTLEHLSTFIAIRALSSLPWLAEWATTRTDDGWIRMVLDARLRFLRAYLAGYR